MRPRHTHTDSNMLVLFETPAGFAVFKCLDEKKLMKSDNLYEDFFASSDDAKKMLKLKTFDKFNDTTEALSAATASVEGKMSKGLKKLLKKLDVKDKLAVADAKLANAIQSKLDLQCVADSKIHELMRCIRGQMDQLIPEKEMTAMALGLAHSLSRYKLKFSPDKIDTMIVQAVSLLDDLDKELNNYVMRCREWYGWHFPELGKIVPDNVAYVRTVLALGLRENAAGCGDALSEILPEDVEEKVKEAAEISMGTEISSVDIENIKHLCKQVLEIQEYRAQLYEYLKNRMIAIAPNLTVMVGELVRKELITLFRAISKRFFAVAGRRQTHFSRRLLAELGQTPGFNGANPRFGEGPFQGAENESRHAQIRFDLPRPVGRLCFGQAEGQGQPNVGRQSCSGLQSGRLDRGHAGGQGGRSIGGCYRSVGHGTKVQIGESHPSVGRWIFA